MKGSWVTSYPQLLWNILEKPFNSQLFFGFYLYKDLLTKVVPGPGQHFPKGARPDELCPARRAGSGRTLTNSNCYIGDPSDSNLSDRNFESRKTFFLFKYSKYWKIQRYLRYINSKLFTFYEVLLAGWFVIPTISSWFRFRNLEMAFFLILKNTSFKMKIKFLYNFLIFSSFSNLKIWVKKVS